MAVSIIKEKIRVDSTTEVQVGMVACFASNTTYITSFLTAYSQDIWDSFNTDALFQSGGSWYNKISSIISDKVKSDALK